MPVPGGTTRKLLNAEEPHHRVVDDQVDRVQRVDLLGVGAELGHGVAHGGQVDHRRHAGEVLHQHPRRAEADLVFGLALVLDPGGHRFQVGLGDRIAVFMAQQVLQQHLHGHGQAGNVLQPARFRGGQAVVLVGLVADR
jgi:hypothetical protein